MACKLSHCSALTLEEQVSQASILHASSDHQTMSPVMHRWDKSLGTLLNYLVKYMGKRLASEYSPKDPEDEKDFQQESTAAHRQPLDEATQRRVVGVLVRLSGRAQYSKVGTKTPLTSTQQHSILRLRHCKKECTLETQPQGPSTEFYQQLAQGKRRCGLPVSCTGHGILFRIRRGLCTSHIHKAARYRSMA